MTEAEIAGKARFDYLRYAQLWEDADVLTAALTANTADITNGNQIDQPRDTLVSICSAGDNALAMLTLNPKRVVTIDLSKAQIAALRLRIGAYRTLDHDEFLQLMGSQPSGQREQLLQRVLSACDTETKAFWNANKDLLVRHGAGGAGKFEKYFRVFRRYVLPLAHRKKTIDEMFVSRTAADREDFINKRFITWRWRLLLKFFFSNTTMGALGRDKAFFDHVEGSLSEHVASRVHHAAVTCDPVENPYLQWIFLGRHTTALPMAWRAEYYQTIRDRLDRITIVHGSIEEWVSSGEKADGFNLSDIFEYMSPDVFEAVYGQLLSASNRDARLVYWNMMVPRRVPQLHIGKVITQSALEDALKRKDKAFFYSDFVIEDVV